MTVRLVLVVDAVDPVTGRLQREDGNVPFTGWLDLVRAISDAIGDDRSASGDDRRHLGPIGDAELGEDV